ncbi:hypothetical protein Pint_25154 [Pistacia integerrima]|uniref:Uncharacterized protein n=1 Tax=Pistacia integerrima TaxID=434235 RepID=A0ACC0YIL6_9ROSI|nr:hypothetical protein Pint_25154 [Pistacia integerrima]
MWYRAARNCRWNIRRFCTAVRRHVDDEGDWIYSSEWWGTESDGYTVLRSTSDKGNGIVSVLSYPSSRPSKDKWPEMERWLEQRYTEIYGNYERFRVLGYQWRTLRFNEDTRQSTAKITAAYRESEPGSVFLMQQPHCLAVPYLKSMVSTGLATIASCNYDLMSAVHGKKTMNILCIGHGGGSLPLFLASKIQGGENSLAFSACAFTEEMSHIVAVCFYHFELPGRIWSMLLLACESVFEHLIIYLTQTYMLLSGAVVHIVEIDPIVISASVQAMGFPYFSVMTPLGERFMSKPDINDEVLWKGIHERIYLYESDAEKFILQNNNVYDLVFIDAYDGDDIFPHKLRDPDSPFINTLRNQLHPEHGTVVVNLHSDSDFLESAETNSYFGQQLPPMGKYVTSVSHVYKDVLLENGSSRDGKIGSGLAFSVSVPWVCNSTLVVCRGFRMDGGYYKRDFVLNTVISKSLELELVLNLPFPCFQYIKRGFRLID